MSATPADASRTPGIDLSGLVRPGDTVVFGQAAGQPLALTGALVEQREAVGPVRAFAVLTYDRAIQAAHRGRIQMVALGASGSLARLARTATIIRLRA